MYVKEEKPIIINPLIANRVSVLPLSDYSSESRSALQTYHIGLSRFWDAPDEQAVEKTQKVDWALGGFLRLRQ